MRPGGAWGVPDSKRLWHHAQLRFGDMSVPEAQLLSHDAARQQHKEQQHGGGGGKAGGAGGLEVAVTVLSAGDFDVHVRGLPEQQQHAQQHHHEQGSGVAVRGARLAEGRLEAEVQHRR